MAWWSHRWADCLMTSTILCGIQHDFQYLVCLIKESSLPNGCALLLGTRRQTLLISLCTTQKDVSCANARKAFWRSFLACETRGWLALFCLSLGILQLIKQTIGWHWSKNVWFLLMFKEVFGLWTILTTQRRKRHKPCWCQTEFTLLIVTACSMMNELRLFLRTQIEIPKELFESFSRNF